MLMELRGKIDLDRSDYLLVRIPWNYTVLK